MVKKKNRISWVNMMSGIGGGNMKSEDICISHRMLCLGDLLKYQMTSDISIDKTFNNWCHKIPQLVPVLCHLFVICLLQHVNSAL